jgi:hypothetical protein
MKTLKTGEHTVVIVRRPGRTERSLVAGSTERALSSREFRGNSRNSRIAQNTFGARNLAGVAGHARRSSKQTTKERKVENV